MRTTRTVTAAMTGFAMRAVLHMAAVLLPSWFVQVHVLCPSDWPFWQSGNAVAAKFCMPLDDAVAAWAVAGLYVSPWFEAIVVVVLLLPGVLVVDCEVPVVFWLLGVCDDEPVAGVGDGVAVLPEPCDDEPDVGAGVGVGVGDGDGDGLGEGVGEGLGAGLDATVYSYGPMSKVLPCGRVWPSKSMPGA